MPISAEKERHLRALTTPSGSIDALAMDQRRSLRRMIAAAANVPPEQISAGQLSEFKTAVTKHLSPYASAVLVDPEYGLPAAAARAPGCGLLLTYEADGYDNPRPFKMLALMPEYSVRRLRDLGANGIKILLSYTPFDDASANDQKCALIERIGFECEAAGVPFLLEPVGYDPQGMDPLSLEYARLKPEIVIRSMEEFSQDIYKVDVLKVEFPINAAYVEGSPVYRGERAYSREEALEFYRRADAAARRPYIYLSAGVGTAQFTASLELAAAAGAGFSGVLCGRATWQGGIEAYAQTGIAAFESWLATSGVANIQAINACLAAAAPVV